jgi:putative membrane protein
MKMPSSQAHVTSADIAPRSEDATSVSMPTEVQTPPPKETAGTPTAVASPTGAPTPSPAMSDAQITALLEAAIDGELSQARAAAKRTKNAQVRNLADRIALDEGAAGADLTALEARHPMVSQGNEDSEKLRATNASTLAVLRAAHGADLDQTYLDTQVAETARLIALLDGTLIPSAQNAELRDELTHVRAMLATHAQMARDAQAARMAPGSTP